VPSPIKKIVVTGANANIGKNVVRQLKEQGYHVTGLVRKPAGLAIDDLVTEWMTNSKTMQALRGADVIVNLTGEIFGKRGDDFYQPSIAPAERIAQAIKGPHLSSSST